MCLIEIRIVFKNILKNIQKFSELMVIIWYNFSASVNRYQKRGD